VKSKYVKPLESVKLEEAFSYIPQGEKTFIDSIIKWLSEKEAVFKYAASQIGNDDAEQYAKAYTDILCTLCNNYETLLIEQSETSTKLFSLLICCSSAPNLRISHMTLSFWDDFKNTLFTYVPDLHEKQSLFMYYSEVCRVMLSQTKKDLTAEEGEDDARGFDVDKYREQALDVYFKGFYVLVKVFKEKGEALFFDLIRAPLRSEDPATFESGIFATKSILDALEETKSHIDFLDEVY